MLYVAACTGLVAIAAGWLYLAADALAPSALRRALEKLKLTRR